MNTNGNTNDSKGGGERSAKRRRFTVIRIALIIICLIVCVFSGYKIISSIVSNRKAEKVYGSIESDLESLFEAAQSESHRLVWTRGEPYTGEPIPNDSDASSSTSVEDSETTDVYVTSDISDLSNTFESVSEPTPDTEPVESQTEGESETRTEPEPNTGSETETETEVKPETESQTERETETETETEKATEAPTLGSDTSDSDDSEPLKADIRSYILELQKKNPDVVAIIYINMTFGKEKKVIQYPVVLPDDNQYYLSHDVYGNSLKEGTIFFDKDTDPSILDNKNLVAYGHNMIGGTMFANLHYFKFKDVFDNTEIKIYTAEHIYIYEPFSVYNTTATAGYCQMSFENDSQFLSFLYDVRRESIWYNDNIGTFGYSDRIITLSTCYGFSTPNGRTAVHGILTRIESYE